MLELLAEARVVVGSTREKVVEKEELGGGRRRGVVHTRFAFSSRPACAQERPPARDTRVTSCGFLALVPSLPPARGVYRAAYRPWIRRV